MEPPGRSQRVFPNDGSWARTSEALACDHRLAMSNSPAALLKPENELAEGLGRSFIRSYSARRLPWCCPVHAPQDL